MNKALIFLFFAIFFINSVNAAHFIVGYVNNSFSGTNANGNIAILWNPIYGQSDNVTDIIGTSGNSGTSNFYLIDCELLTNGCNIGEVLKVKLLNSSYSEISSDSNVTISGNGYDVVSTLRINSNPFFYNISIDDSFFIPASEIDLTPASSTTVNCSGVFYDYDGETNLKNVSAVFFNSTYSAVDDNNNHYTNSSCLINSAYGNANESWFMCSFNVQYYANPGNWNCTVVGYDNHSGRGISSNRTIINTLLALEVADSIDFGLLVTNQLTNETLVNVTNMGNVRFNLSLKGYGANENDGLAMNCSTFGNISVGNIKYNLTAPNFGAMTLGQSATRYTNLSSSLVNRSFNINYRQNDVYNEAVNLTYWRAYIPPGAMGSCSGNIIFKAITAPGI